MATIWGHLERVHDDLQDRRWVEVKMALSGRTAIRIRALVGNATLVARGVKRVDLSALCIGEPVEISYHNGRDGFMEADTIYVQPEQIPAA